MIKDGFAMFRISLTLYTPMFFPLWMNTTLSAIPSSWLKIWERRIRQLHPVFKFNCKVSEENHSLRI
jgi:hypothetical protein